jgi:hypothetical protein
MDGNPRRLMEAYLIDDILEFYGWSKKRKGHFNRHSDKEAVWRLTKKSL